MPDPALKKGARILKAVAAVILLLALFFVPAGTLNWPEAWIFIVLYLAVICGLLLWMKKKNPGLLKERQRKKPEAKRWDKILVRVYSGLLTVMFIVIGLDAVRFRWSRVPMVLKAIGFLGLLPASAIMFWALRENAYLSDMVVIQEERGHKVCTTGPYRYVRHPYYLGVIFFFLLIPLALGSFYGLIPGLAVGLLFIVRTALEDRTLRKELPGYQDYARDVRHKLLPGIW
ncbi:MAG: isoprenylcysteine carboxylmethyltransferase family protein [Candidatus Aminicenantes bacterium]|nr:isoprenylcysteine carboxylmethyltransferase family protein [Candidatus Aminicenantes bacterium]